MFIFFPNRYTCLEFLSSGIFTWQSKNMKKLSPNRAQLFVRIKYTVFTMGGLSGLSIVSIIQTYRPWTPRRMSGWIVNKKIWRESQAHRNFGKWFDWSLALKRHIVMAAPCTVTAPSSNQNLMNSSSRRLDGKLRSLDDWDYQMEMRKYNSALLSLFIYVWGLLGPLISGTQKRKQKRKLWWSRKFAVGEIHNIFRCFIN